MPKVNVKDQRRKQLVDAAISAIAKRGVMEVTITDVAEIAGLSRGIINFYFVAKDTLIEQSFKTLLAGFEAVWRKDIEQTEGMEPQERLASFVRSLFSSELCNQRRMSAWLACFGLAAHDKTYKQLAKQYAAKFETAAQPLFDAAKNEFSAMGLLVMVQGAWQQLALDWSAESRDGAAEDLVGMILNQPHTPKQQAKPVKKSTIHGEPVPEFDFGDLFVVKG